MASQTTNDHRCKLLLIITCFFLFKKLVFSWYLCLLSVLQLYCKKAIMQMRQIYTGTESLQARKVLERCLWSASVDQ